MANPASMHVDGLKELLNALRTLPADLQEKELADCVRAGALVIRDDARLRAPVLKVPDPRRTQGLLRRMIQATRGVRRGSEATAFVRVRVMSKSAIRKFKERTGKSGAQNPNDPFYWGFVEFGTSKMRAQPFVRPAFDTKKEAAVGAIAAALRAGIDKALSRISGKKLF